MNFSVAPPQPPNGETRYYGDPATPDLVWLMLRHLMEVPEKGRELFAKPLANQNRLWREFANYVRQANAYWEAAVQTRGSSAALLYYYAFLNLAKAELLTTAPTAILGQRVHHGLVFRPTESRSIGGDRLKVVDGVFKLLYEKRTGQVLPTNSILRVTRLFLMVPEIGLELREGNFGEVRPLTGYQTIVRNGTAAWPLLCFLARGFLDDRRESVTSTLMRHFEEVDPDQLGSAWRRIFSLSGRLTPDWLAVLQAKKTFSGTKSSGELYPDYPSAARLLRTVLDPYVSDPVTRPVEFLLSPSLLKSRPLPMPPPLARYALMFYVSSLVRYKPSALDPVREARQAWLIDSFTKEAPLHLLAAAHSGIRGVPEHFEAAGYRT